MNEDPPPGPIHHATHRRGPSWQSLTSPRNSTGSDRGAAINFEPNDLGLGDAFDDTEEAVQPDFVTAINELKRESIDTAGRESLANEIAGPGEDDVPTTVPHSRGWTEPMIEVSLDNSSQEQETHTNLPPASTPPQIQYEDIELSPASPSAPSIVVSRPTSPRSDPNQFVQVSLSPEQAAAPRAPVPRRIYVPPAGISSGVQIVQGPPTPTSPRPGTRPSSRSTASPSRQIEISMPTSSTTPSGATSPNGHRPKRSTGISTQDVISKTRPSHLPPKSKQEDSKHLRDWEEMMQRSRLADEQRKQKLKERRLAREQAVEDSLVQWEKEVLPDWKAAIRDPRLRQLWWKGIPTKIRGRIWYLTLGNALALSKDSYKSCLSRAKRALASNAFPADILHQIEEEIPNTLPALHLFHPETGPMYQDLKDLLCAWMVSRADEGLSYIPGAATMGAMFLINMPPDQAFVSMRNMIERHCLRSFYGGSGAKDDVEAYYRIFDTLLADVMPKVYFNFKQHGISPSLYLHDWIICIFLRHLPFEACSRIWDVLMLEGDSFLFRTSIAILGVLESRLFFPDRQELLEVLHGENKAALDVARRTESLVVDLGARYEQYGMTEEALWERLEQNEWKDSTWSRLIQRELPDI